MNAIAAGSIAQAEIDHPDLLEHVCTQTAAGGSPADVAEALGLRLSDLFLWIYSKQHPERAHAYNAAVDIQTRIYVRQLVDQLHAMATIDLRRAYAQDGSLKPIHEIPAEVARSIKEIVTQELWAGSGEDREQIGEVKRVTFWDKTKAIELLGKQLAMFVERHEVTHVTLADLVTGGRDAPMPTLLGTGGPPA